MTTTQHRHHKQQQQQQQRHDLQSTDTKKFKADRSLSNNSIRGGAEN